MRSDSSLRHRDGQVFMIPRFILVFALSSSLCAQVPDLYDMDTLRDVYLQFDQVDWWSQLESHYGTDQNIAADMTVDGVTYEDVGVRFRGATSYYQLPPQGVQGWEKKSFNVELDAFVPGQDVYGYDSLNFNNGFHDPLFLREPLTYYVMRQHGVAPKANWIRLWLNGSYWGVYINVQQPNKDMMKEWFRSNDGNRYRGVPTTGAFDDGRCAYRWLGADVQEYLAAYQAKQGDGLDLMNLCDVLENTASGALQSVLTDVLNVDSFFRYAAVMNVTTQTDSYLRFGKDHFLYMDEVHGDGSVFPFDVNEAMQESVTLSPTEYTTDPFRPAFTETLQFADWAARYRAHMDAVLTHTFNPTELTPVAQHYHAMIAADVASDSKKIYSTQAFQQNLDSDVDVLGPWTIFGAPTVTVPGLVPFIAARHAFLSTHPEIVASRADLSALAHTPAMPAPGQAIQVTVVASPNAASVDLWWRDVGKFEAVPMFDDGAHGDGAAGDGVWGATLPGQSPGTLLDYYVEAKTATGAARFEPHTAELERSCPHVLVDWPVVPSVIVINEFLAQNQTGDVDEHGQHEDWVELHNTSAQTIDVGGMALSDTLQRPKWELPIGTTIAPFGFLRVWCDEDGRQGPLHANFKLSARGEEIVLFQVGGQAIHERVVFGQQYVDVSTGRLLDGGSAWGTFPVPSGGVPNEPTACGQRRYGAIDPTEHGVSLGLTGPLQPGTTLAYSMSGGPQSGLAWLLLGFAPDAIDLGPVGLEDVTLLLSPLTIATSVAMTTDAQGAAAFDLAIPNVPAAVSQRLYAQAIAARVAGFDGSRAIEARICP